MRRSILSVGFVAGTVAATVAATLLASAPATAQSAAAHHRGWYPHLVYVAPGGGSSWDSSCHHAGFSDIQTAVDSVADGTTIVVCRGTYQTSVTVDHRVTLSGRPGAVIDATGQPYGIGVSASYVTIAGMTVENASSDAAGSPNDGIITAGFTANGPVAANHVSIIGNTVTGNLGSGIDLNSTSYSSAIGNRAHDNGVGVNVSDDLGLPAAHNLVEFNVTNTNFGGCGIALADHTGAGVTGTIVRFNVSNDNGLSTPTAPDASAGSGVIMASPIPGGTVSGNLIAFNSFRGNGHGGVVVHAHAPGTDFSGNRIVYNRIGTNNLRTDTSDTQTTGIYLGSAGPLSITVRGNRIGPDYYGIFTAGPVTVNSVSSNSYHRVTTQLGTVSTY